MTKGFPSTILSKHLRSYINPQEANFNLTEEEGKTLATSFGVALLLAFGSRTPNVRLEDFHVVWDKDVQELQFKVPGVVNLLCYGPSQLCDLPLRSPKERAVNAAVSPESLLQAAKTLAERTAEAVSSPDVIEALRDLGVVYETE